MDPPLHLLNLIVIQVFRIKTHQTLDTNLTFAILAGVNESMGLSSLISQVVGTQFICKEGQNSRCGAEKCERPIARRA